MLLRNLTLTSLLVFFVSLAATQTVYGKSFLAIRWISLIAFGSFGALSMLTKDRYLPLKRMHAYVAIYIFLWSMTAIFGVYPRFSTYRLLAHLLIVVSSLVFLPQIVNISNASKLLIALKIIIGTTLLVSYIKPAPLNVFDTGNEFRGIFGNANSFGHMCAIGCLLFLHGFLTRMKTRWGYIQLVLALLSGALMLRSGARSSTVALIAGLLALFFIYRRQSSRNLLFGWSILFISLVVAITLQGKIQGFIYKRIDSATTQGTISHLTMTRLPIWTASWEAFKERPLLGWGFGVDSDTDLSNWNGQFTALGFTKRDTVNDLTYTLETGGVVGAFAYFFMLSLLLGIWTSNERLKALKLNLHPSDYEIAASGLEVQQLFMCLALSLAVMFEFDGTALSAGYFFAPLLWVSLGVSAALRSLLLYDLPRRMCWTYYSAYQPIAVSRSLHTD